MSKPTTSDNSSAVGLFPFLAVLLCTMGALLVLLVILAQRIGIEPIMAVVQPAKELPVSEPVVDSAAVDELEAELQAIRQYQRELAQLEAQGEQRLEDERNRLSHLEAHIRRMEHELAQLSLAVKQLKETESSQEVDQEQAEHELERLQQLIKDTETQLEDMREMAGSEHSYAVVPFKGRNGTYAKPVYIVCDRDGITLQPEGLRFKPTDFVDPRWPGNPLSAALRASREYLKEKARKTGETNPQDPYPLILVRPSGIKYYRIAREAITSWDASFGYEFIDADWKITYPDLPDPGLAESQQHAVMIARERLSRLATAAPSKFRGVAGLNPNADTGQSGVSLGADGRASGGRYASAGNANATGFGQADATGDYPGPGAGDAAGEPRYGAVGSGGAEQAFSSIGPYGGQPTAEGQSGAGQSESGAAAGNSGQQAGGGATAQNGGDGAAGAPGGSEEISYAGSAQGGEASGSPNGGSSQGGAASSSSNSRAQAGASSTACADCNQDSLGPPNLEYAKQQSIADARGSDWAIKQAMNNAVPIRRPIQVVVRDSQIALLPSRHLKRGAGATGTVISLDQSLQQISSEFEQALKDRIEEWGLAGNGLYWRPVLELHVGPEADQTAMRLIKLLKNSGVDVRLPETANSQRGQGAYESR